MKPHARLWRKFGSSLLDALIPRSCLGCSRAVDDHSPYRYICKACAPKIHLVGNQPCCPTCGAPYAGAIAVSQACPHCKELEPNYSEGKSLMLYRDLSREMIHRLKYEGALYLLPDIERIVASHHGLRDFVGQAVLVPVPLYPRKERERGFNQSDVLARAIHRQTAGTQVSPLLKRTKDTSSQTRLDRAARNRNVKNAFALSENVVLDARLIHIIIDDVFTTGSTLNACAGVLRKAGVRHIRVLTLCHG